MALTFDEKMHVRFKEYGRLMLVCIVMLAFSGFLLHFQTTSNAAQSAQSRSSILHRFCFLIIVFLWCLLGLTTWAARQEIGPDPDIVGTSNASARPLRTALATLLTLVALLGVGVGWNAFLSAQHLQARSTQFLSIENDSDAFLFLLAALTAGFVEEYVFRGYLQRRFSRLTESVWGGTSLQLAFFALAHLYQGWSGLMSVLLLGAVLTTTALKCKTLVPGMIAHALGDALGPLTYLAHHSIRGAR